MCIINAHHDRVAAMAYRPRSYRRTTTPYHRPVTSALSRVAASAERRESEGADHFLKAGLSPMQILRVELAAERRSRTAPTFSAGMVAAAARGRRLSGGQVERGNMRTGW